MCDKDLVFICSQCGNAVRIGANKSVDYETGRSAYNMYMIDFSFGVDKIISIDDYLNKEIEDSKAIYKIIYSQGYKVPMMSGMYATDYAYGRFSDRWYPDFWAIQRKDVTAEEVINFIDEYNKNRTTVNMSRFIRETPENVLEEVSNYHIEAFDWKGTEYENKPNH